MDTRKYALMIAFTLALFASKAQVIKSFEQGDSTINQAYIAGDWKHVMILGRQALAQGIDYPGLRLQIGYANFITGNYSEALREYDHLLQKDAFNQTARYYAYLCSKYLNNDLSASYYAARLYSNQLKDEKITPFDPISIGLEAGFKDPGEMYRSSGAFFHISESNRLTWRLQLDQSFLSFSQSIDNPLLHQEKYTFPLLLGTVNNIDQQYEYYAKLSFTVTGKITLVGAYHYLNTNFQNITYNSNIGLAGLKYRGTYFDVQGDFNWGYMIDRNLLQYNAGLLFYPLGNLDFYTTTRYSYLNQNAKGQTIISQSIGFKIVKNTWLETTANFGNQDNYIDTDGLYIYNSIDATKLKLGETVFYQLGKHAQVKLNYAFEKKDDDKHYINYNQSSITAGLLWKF